MPIVDKMLKGEMFRSGKFQKMKEPGRKFLISNRVKKMRFIKLELEATEDTAEGKAKYKKGGGQSIDCVLAWR